MKRLIEKVLRLAPATPHRMRGRSVILAYHNVVPDALQGLGDRSLHLPLGAFLQQIDLIQAHCRVVSLPDLLAGAASDEGPVVALTFDDAYRGAVDLALPELARRGLPSTLFVAPDLLGRRSLWWDDLAAGAGGLAADARQRALDTWQGRHDRIPAGARGAAARSLPECYGCASEAQVRALSGLGTVTLGAHSWSHPNLTRIDPAALADELSLPLDWLRAATGPTVAVLAYPYGLASPTVEAAVEKAGYAAALLVDGGWFGRGAGPWRIPRFNVPAGLSEDGLLLRLAGVLPLAPHSSVS